MISVINTFPTGPGRRREGEWSIRIELLHKRGRVSILRFDQQRAIKAAERALRSARGKKGRPLGILLGSGVKRGKRTPLDRVNARKEGAEGGSGAGKKKQEKAMDMSQKLGGIHPAPFRSPGANETGEEEDGDKGACGSNEKAAKKKGSPPQKGSLDSAGPGKGGGGSLCHIFRWGKKGQTFQRKSEKTTEKKYKLG